jgi:hypothetical protein
VPRLTDAVLSRLDRAQDQHGHGLALGEGEHAFKDFKKPTHSLRPVDGRYVDAASIRKLAA